MEKETQEQRWARKGLDPRYGPRWYLHYDGRPPLDDDSSYVWNAASRSWQKDFDDEEAELDEAAFEAWEEQRRVRLAERNEY